jgi:hypothetical protein
MQVAFRMQKERSAAPQRGGGDGGDGGMQM